MIASASLLLRCIPIVVLLFETGCLRVDEEPSPATGHTEQSICPVIDLYSHTTNNVPCDPICGDGICASSEACESVCRKGGLLAPGQQLLQLQGNLELPVEA